MADSDFEILDPRFEPLVKTAAQIEKLWTGARWAEGPAYFHAHRSLIWSDIPNDRIMRWDETTGTVGVFRSGQGRYANGNTVDREGRLVSCEHGTRSVTRTEHDGSITTIADRYDGKRLNSPNDVVVRSDGMVFFTDPAYGIDSDYEGFQSPLEQDGCHVYRADPATGAVVKIADDFVRPNGLAFSLDEKTLYIADTGATHVVNGPRHIRTFQVAEDGSLSGGEVFCVCDAGLFDGFRLDSEGRIWSSAGDGVHCFLPDGTLIGKIKVPETVANIVFGGPKHHRLFIAATTSLYAVMLPVNGARTF